MTISLANSLQDDATPYKRLVKTASASVTTAESGSENLFIDSADNILKKKDSAGTVTAAATATNSFATIAVSGQSDVVADSSTDTLTLAAGTGVTLTTNAGTDTITLAATAAGVGTPVYVQAGASTYTTTSTSFAAIHSSLDITVTVSAVGSVIIMGNIDLKFSTTGDVYLGIGIDASTPAVEHGGHAFDGAARYPTPFNLVITGIAAGSHTFKLYWRVSSGTATMEGASRSASYRETTWIVLPL